MTAPDRSRLPYPPPWMDMATLCAHICVSANTVDNWVAKGILPRPRKRGHTLLWKWAEVDERLTIGANEPDSETARIRDGTRKAAAEGRASY